MERKPSGIHEMFAQTAVQAAETDPVLKELLQPLMVKAGEAYRSQVLESFEFVPIELISQILLYLDVDEIEQSIEVYPQFKSVINQKIF